MVHRAKYKPWKRDIRFLYQRLTRGWSDEDTFSMDGPLAKLIAPRLKRFAELRRGHPSGMSEKEWEDIINKMVAAFEWYASDDRYGPDEFKNIEKHQEGIDLFAQFYCGLWW
jgi:hypothetical protein